MLNYFYIYSFIWGFVLALYQLGWSSLNAPLNPILVVFFLVTIIVSVFLGYKFRDLFNKSDGFSGLSTLPLAFLAVIVACTAIGLYQLGYIPIINLFMRTLDYGELLATNGSIFRTVSICGSIFGSVYQFAVYIDQRDKRDLLYLAICLLITSLYSSRSTWMICLFCFLVIFSTRFINRWNYKYSLIVVLLALSALWLFGVYGNIRTGGSWDDSSFIYIYGCLKGRWPDFVPRQFGWAYIYLTSPLANLNYNLVNLTQDAPIDIYNYIYDFLPMFLAKRLPYYSAIQAKLVVPYLTVSSVWTNYLLHLGVIGLVAGYLCQMLLMGFAGFISRNTPFHSLTLVFCSECVAFSFFVNSFTYPTMSYPLLVSLLFSVTYVFLKKHPINVGKWLS